MTQFADLGLSAPLLRAVAAEGYETATPIQAGAIPPLLQGKDVLGLAQTGTGKTAALALPILQRFSEDPRKPAPRSTRALVLTPTRELAVQVGQSFATYGKNLNLRHAVIHGGVSERPQISALARGVDILVATPGRLLDLMGQRHVQLDSVEVFVLDEADRMLDMGFAPDLKRIVAVVPKKRQTLLFSATMPDAIANLAAELLAKDFVRVEVVPQSTTVEQVEQRVLFVEKANKRKLLAELFSDRALARAIVFARTKHGANRIAEELEKAGVDADAIHGNKSQNARQRALDRFKAGRLRALVATDIAARGIDVEDVSHVINYDLPNEPESYVHRIGRTGRAGRGGVALSFCDAEEVAYLKQIEKTIRQSVPADEAHPFHAPAIARLRASVQGRGPDAAHGRGRPSQGAGRPANGKSGANRRPGRPRRSGSGTGGARTAAS